MFTQWNTIKTINMYNNMDQVTRVFLSKCLQMKLYLKEYVPFNLICIELETSKENPIQIKVIIDITLILST